MCVVCLCACVLCVYDMYKHVVYVYIYVYGMFMCVCGMRVSALIEGNLRLSIISLIFQHEISL